MDANARLTRIYILQPEREETRARRVAVPSRPTGAVSRLVSRARLARPDEASGTRCYIASPRPQQRHSSCGAHGGRDRAIAGRPVYLLERTHYVDPRDCTDNQHRYGDGKRREEAAGFIDDEPG